MSETRHLIRETKDYRLKTQDPRQRNREACTPLLRVRGVAPGDKLLGKLQDEWRMAEKRRISNINRYAISLSNCPKLSSNPRIKTVEYTVLLLDRGGHSGYFDG